MPEPDLSAKGRLYVVRPNEPQIGSSTYTVTMVAAMPNSCGAVFK